MNFRPMNLRRVMPAAMPAKIGRITAASARYVFGQLAVVPIAGCRRTARFRDGQNERKKPTRMKMTKTAPTISGMF